MDREQMSEHWQCHAHTKMLQSQDHLNGSRFGQNENRHKEWGGSTILFWFLLGQTLAGYIQL